MARPLPPFPGCDDPRNGPSPPDGQFFLIKTGCCLGRPPPAFSFPWVPFPIEISTFLLLASFCSHSKGKKTFLSPGFLAAVLLSSPEMGRFSLCFPFLCGFTQFRCVHPAGGSTFTNAHRKRPALLSVPRDFLDVQKGELCSYTCFLFAVVEESQGSAPSPQCCAPMPCFQPTEGRIFL